MQITWDSINVAYPYDMEPLELLRSLNISVPKDVELTGWEANRFAGFEHSADPTGVIGAFIDDYFERVLKLTPSEFTVKVTRQRLAGLFRSR